MKGVVLFMSERFLAMLENNHHYIIVDSVTGYSYYIPGQVDSNNLCTILNSQDDTIERQRHHIKELETSLKRHNISFEQNRTCKNCNHMSVNYVNDGSDGYCELKELGVGVDDYCKGWTLKI